MYVVQAQKKHLVGAFFMHLSKNVSTANMRIISGKTKGDREPVALLLLEANPYFNNSIILKKSSPDII